MSETESARDVWAAQREEARQQEGGLEVMGTEWGSADGTNIPVELESHQPPQQSDSWRWWCTRSSMMRRSCLTRSMHGRWRSLSRWITSRLEEKQTRLHLQREQWSGPWRGWGLQSGVQTGPHVHRCQSGWRRSTLQWKVLTPQQRPSGLPSRKRVRQLPNTSRTETSSWAMKIL